MVKRKKRRKEVLITDDINKATRIAIGGAVSIAVIKGLFK